MPTSSIQMKLAMTPRAKVTRVITTGVFMSLRA